MLVRMAVDQLCLYKKWLSCVEASVGTRLSCRHPTPLAQSRDWWWAFVNRVKMFRFYKGQGISRLVERMSSFSARTACVKLVGVIRE
jgi:hypothetical protein